MKNFRLIESDSALIELQSSFREANILTLAVDFEAEFTLHEFGERLCIVQVYDGKRYYVLDALRIGRKALSEFLADRKILKLFFGASSDVQLVFKQFDVHLNSVLDLQILAGVSGVQKLGLDSVLTECLGIPAVAGKGKYQMHNWTTRPLAADALDYALRDVEHLFALHDFLVGKLEGSKRLAEALRQLVLQSAAPLTTGTPAAFRSPEYKGLSEPNRRLFEKVIGAREQMAVELNWAPENLLPRGQIARLLTGALSLNHLPKPKKMSDAEYQRMKSLVEKALEG